MKKRVVMAAILGMALAAAGCSNNTSETTTEAQTGTETVSEADTAEGTEAGSEEAAAERPEYNALDYVTLGEYKGIEVTLASTEVTEEEIDSEIASTISQNGKMETLEEGTVENGDIANIDYEGTKDGVAFDGGTDKGYDLTIGSGSFIEGFESGLIGTEVGSSVDLNLTFPEDYNSEELAGQAVVFHVTVNSIQRAPELNDELAAELSENAYTTVADYRESIRTTLAEQKESTRDSQQINDLMSQVYDNSTINEYPEDVVAYDVQSYIDYYTSYAEQSSQTLAEFLEANYEMTEDDFNTQIDTMVKQSLSQELILKAIIETEGLEISDEEYEVGALDYAEQYGFESVEALEEQYTRDVVIENLLMDKALNVVRDNALITDGESEESAESESETGSEAESETETETE